MEIYKDLSNPSSKEFEQLLNNQLSKIIKAWKNRKRVNKKRKFNRLRIPQETQNEL